MAELDSLLAELDGIALRSGGGPGAPTAAPASAAAPAAPAPAPVPTIPAPAPVPTIPAPAPAPVPIVPAPTASAAAASDDLDSLVASLQASAPPPQSTAPVPAPARAPAPAPVPAPAPTRSPAGPPAPPPPETRRTMHDNRRMTRVIAQPTAGLDHCARCGGAIKGEHVLALDRAWHLEHFACDNCSAPITGDFFESDGRRTCKRCSESKYRCSKCGGAITGEYFVGDNKMLHPGCLEQAPCHRCGAAITTHEITALSRKYHPECFLCRTCASRLGTSFFQQDGEPVCEACVRQAGLKTGVRCDECGGAVEGSYLSFSTKSYHVGCLKCFSCRVVLPADAFYQVDDKPACLSCAQKA